MIRLNCFYYVMVIHEYERFNMIFNVIHIYCYGCQAVEYNIYSLEIMNERDIQT